MIRGLLRGALAAALAMAGAAAAPVAAIPAVAAPPAPAGGACAGDSGVTVVVDFGELGGGVLTRCAPEPVSTGFEALEKAGFTWEGTVRFPGLLCRIDGRPSPEQDPCHNAPSARFYWAYWTASSPGGAWTYSDLGAGNRDPAPGSVDGWAFSVGCKRQPGQPTPCPATTTTVAPATTAAPPPPAGPTSAGGGSTGVTGGTPRSPSATGTSTSIGEPAHAAATSTTSALPRSREDRAASDMTDDEVALEVRDSSSSTSAARGGGSPVGAVVGGVVALALLAGAVARQRRRGATTAATTVGETRRR